MAYQALALGIHACLLLKVDGNGAAIIGVYAVMDAQVGFQRRSGSTSNDTVTTETLIFHQTGDAFPFGEVLPYVDPTISGNNRFPVGSITTFAFPVR